MSIVLIDSSSTSLTVSWPETSNGNDGCYILEYKKEDDDEYQTLSNQLKSLQVRKRNLSGTQGFFFRVRHTSSTKEENEWMSHGEPFRLLTKEQEETRLAPPTIVDSGSNTAMISWNTTSTKTMYELQMRRNTGGEAWNTIASNLSNTTVKKKNLQSTCQYQFRVRPTTSPVVVAFSTPSELFQPSSLHPSFFNLFSNGTLLSKQQNNKVISVTEALSHVDFILVYVSAHWCPPCRQYTPQLATLYNSQFNTNNKYGGKSFQIVFVSADHDESSFDDYYQTMPWLAVPYDEDARESIMAYLRIQGIPRLVVFNRRTGAIVDNNAVGKPVESWIYK